MKPIPSILTALIVVWSTLAQAGSFMVESSSDSPDAVPGDGVCLAADLSGCTLRAAIEEANSLAGPDTVIINASVNQISLTEGALVITDNATLVRGESSTTAVDGLLNIGGEPLFRILSDSNTVAGLTLKRSRTDALLIFGQHNQIGGPSAPDAVIIIQNGLDQTVSAGIRVTGSGALGNRMEGCYIGTDLSGGTSFPNKHGIIIELSASQSTIDGCLISGNSGWGVWLRAGAENNTVLNSSIGVDLGGFYALSNGSGGVLITSGAIRNTIGSTDSFPTNVIAGNGGDGILISGTGTSENRVLGSVIGLDATALTSLGNNGTGIRLDDGCSENVVGGSELGTRNLIGGNWLDGIRIENAGTERNRIIGNWIGIAANAFRARSNGLINGNGITIRDRAGNNDIGGPLAGERNVISGELAHAILISGAGTSRNRIRGNFIGLDPTGQYGFYNGSGVVLREGASHNTIGGNTAAERNMISGSANEEYPFGGGVMLYDEGTSYNTVAGNYIGLDAGGGRRNPNATAGVVIGNGASFNLIGGDSPGDGNVISGNGYGTLMQGLGRGVHIEGAGTRRNTISGNLIGTVADGSAGLRNFGHGLAVVAGASENTIGGDSPGAGNTIAYNRYHGIFMNDAGTARNAIRKNSIFANDSASIVILGGAQEGLAAPVIYIAGRNFLGYVAGTSTLQAGTVDIFQAASDNSGAGEPKRFLGTAEVNSAGFWELGGLEVEVGDTVTAIATDEAGNSSGCALNAVVSFYSDIDEDSLALPALLELSQNYPNPFNPMTEIAFSLPAASRIAVTVFNVVGQRVAVLADGRYPAGEHRVRWDARDDSGAEVASGVYFYRLETEDATRSGKMILIK